MNIIEVRDRMVEDDRTKWDQLVEPERLSYRNGRLAVDALYSGCPAALLTPTTWATSQLCRKLNIPAPYFRRCPVGLQDAQFNYWLHEAQDRPTSTPARPERWLLRAKGETLRSALSGRYTCVDNADVLNALDPVLDARYRVEWFNLGDESLHLRLVDPKLARDVLPNDRVMAGVHVANSEVGKRCVTVDALVYRLVCSNGLVRLVHGSSLLYRRHVAVSKPEFEIALRRAVGEALVSSVGFMEQLAWATTRPVPDVERSLHSISTQWGLTQATETSIRRGLLTEHRSQHETLYGLVNAVTHAAQELPADDRYSLETLAARLLENGVRPTPDPAPARRTEAREALEL